MESGTCKHRQLFWLLNITADIIIGASTSVAAHLHKRNLSAYGIILQLRILSNCFMEGN